MKQLNLFQDSKEEGPMYIRPEKCEKCVSMVAYHLMPLLSPWRYPIRVAETRPGNREKSRTCEICVYL